MGDDKISDHYEIQEVVQSNQIIKRVFATAPALLNDYDIDLLRLSPTVGSTIPLYETIKEARERMVQSRSDWLEARAMIQAEFDRLDGMEALTASFNRYTALLKVLERCLELNSKIVNFR